MENIESMDNADKKEAKRIANKKYYDAHKQKYKELLKQYRETHRNEYNEYQRALMTKKYEQIRQSKQAISV